MANDGGSTKVSGQARDHTSFLSPDDEKTDPGIVLEAPVVISRDVRPSESRAPDRPSPSFRVPISLPGLTPPPLSPVVRVPSDPRFLLELGPLRRYFEDAEITEISVNDTRNISFEKNGKLQVGPAISLDELNQIIRNILDRTGRPLTPDHPYVDVSLPDGSRVHIAVPPVALHGPMMSIRKFPQRRQSLADLIGLGTMDQRIGYFLNACVLARINLLISGGTGSGKTTLMNTLLQLIPSGERLVVIEDTPEFVIHHADHVRLQSKPHSPTSEAVNLRDLVRNALRMRPDRLLVGECRGPEALDILLAMNTGHEGSMTTLHANSPRDALSRLETLCLLSGVELPLLAIRKQMLSAIDLVVQLQRTRDGKRQIANVTEVTGIEGETLTLQEIFAHDPASATFLSRGMVPRCIDKIRERGVPLPNSFF